MHKIGDKVFDRATQRWATIVDTCHVNEADSNFMIYILDDSIPDDEDFPHRQRLESEITPHEAPPLPRWWSPGDEDEPTFVPVKGN